MYELFELGRYAEAEKEIRRQLAEDPDDGHAMAMLAICLIELDRKPEALEAAKKAVALQPDNSFTHYTLARTYYDMDQRKLALPAAQEALRLDPAEAAHHGLLAALNYDLRDFERALAYADSGLALDAEHGWCQNVRGLALAKLGRADEAAENMNQALALDPESPIGHASRGWVLTQQGNYKAAEAAFREALRLDASNEWARDGLAEILKTRNWFYRLVFRWKLWMARLDTSKVWMVLVGLYVASRVLGGWARLAYLVFALVTWFADPIANLLLRLHPLGRHLLSKFELQASNLFAGLMAVAIVAGGAAFAVNSVRLLILSFVCAVLGLLAASILSSERMRKSTLIRAFGAGMVVAGLAAIALPGTEALFLFGIGFFLFGWVANAVVLRA